MNATMRTLQIPGKESASIAHHLFSATAPTTPGRMVVFLNGMMGPQMTWHPVIKECISALEVSSLFVLHSPSTASEVQNVESTVIRAHSRVLALLDSLHTIDMPS